MTPRRSVRFHWHAPELLPAIGGFLGGLAIALNHFAELPALSYSKQRVVVSAVLSAIGLATAFVVSHRWIVNLFARAGVLGPLQAPVFARRQAATFLLFLLFTVGATGFRLPGIVLPACILVLFVVANAVLVFTVLPGDPKTLSSSLARVAVLFFASGIAALVYQVTWQRALFSCFGVNIESTTLVVTIFMFGLGVGSIVGGLVSRGADGRTLIKGFLACELIVGAFGLISVPLIREVGSLTVSSSLLGTALVIFGLLLIPTLLMGATLPLLVTYAHRQFSNVGRSVGLLYFVNTLGSALACYLTADVLFVLVGERAATVVAAFLNFGVGFAVYRLLRRAAADSVVQQSRTGVGSASEAETAP